MFTASGLDLGIILLSALIHISIEVIRNNYLDALVHLENPLFFCKLLAQKSKNQFKAIRTLAPTQILVVHSYFWT
jgi:hypothetical protein